MQGADGFPDAAAMDEAQRRRYASNLADWQNWFSAADELQSAAELLKPRVAEWWAGLKTWEADTNRPRTQPFPARGCHSIYMMLSAFVLENLAKGGLIRAGHVQVSTWFKPDTQLPDELKTHGLPALINNIEMPVDEAEEELLHRLARASVWRGRYPVAARYDAMHRPVTVASGKSYSATWFGEKDIDRIETLIEKVRTHVGAVRNHSGARDAAP